MYITTPTYEDMADFMTTMLLCNTCKDETHVVGPLPTKATCGQCGSCDVVPIAVTFNNIAPVRQAA